MTVKMVGDLQGRATPGDHEEYMSVRKAQRLIDERDDLAAALRQARGAIAKALNSLTDTTETTEMRNRNAYGDLTAEGDTP